MPFRIDAVCISTEKGIQKKAVESICLIEDFGIKNDAHAGDTHRQVSLLAGEEIDRMKAEGLKLEPGAFGENIVTRGLDWTKAKVGDRITIDDVELVITQIGKECHTPCAIFFAAGRCIMPEAGIFTKVIKGGTLDAKSRGYHGFG